MKKVLLLLAFIVAGLYTFGQSVASQTADQTIKMDDTRSSTEAYAFKDANIDLTQASDDEAWTLKILSREKVFVDARVELDSVSGTPDVVVKLQGKEFVNDAWTDVATATWTGTTSDTTIVLTQGTASKYRFMQILHDIGVTTQAFTVDKQEIKFYK